MNHSIVPDTADFRDLVIEEQRALIMELSIDPGFGIAPAPRTRYEMRVLSQSAVRIDFYIGDIDNLKQLNSACGSQDRVNELFRPALQVRASDTLFCGRTDAGDQLAYGFPAGQGPEAKARIERELESAEMTEAERRAYVRGVCVKRYGPLVGRIRATLGLHRVAPWPSITFVGYEDIPACELSRLAVVGDRALFEKKAGR